MNCFPENNDGMKITYLSGAVHAMVIVFLIFVVWYTGGFGDWTSVGLGDWTTTAKEKLTKACRTAGVIYYGGCSRGTCGGCSQCSRRSCGGCSDSLSCPLCSRMAYVDQEPAEHFDSVELLSRVVDADNTQMRYDMDPCYMSSRDRVGACGSRGAVRCSSSFTSIADAGYDDVANVDSIGDGSELLHRDTLGLPHPPPGDDDCEYHGFNGYLYKEPCEFVSG